MKVLILGGSGMLGHKLWQTLAPRFETWVTFRGPTNPHAGLFDRHSLTNIRAENFDSVVDTLSKIKPDVVVNCIGIVKQDPAASDPYSIVLVNALFPHQLAKACIATGARLIHISTDCVFTGRRGNYKEADVSDAEDVYGRTKWLGELHYDHSLTIRTSMIGRELSGTNGLVEWFLSQRGKTVRGFQNAIFSGLTTAALSDIIGDLITGNKNLHGVWHVAGDSINKFELLQLLKRAFQVDVEILPDQTFVCDRSLDDSRFRAITGFKVATWQDMIEDMARDQTPYEEIRRTDVNG